jgi:hypothetical protein
MSIPNITTDVTVEEQDSARTILRALLQEQDPTLDISVGGPVDSLLVEGNVIVVARNDQEVSQAYLFQQLKAISEGTVTVTDAELDELMANYFLTRQEAVVASGEIVFVVRDLRVYSFPTGYTLIAKDQQFVTTATYNVYPPLTPNIDFTVATNIAIEQVYDAATGYSYRFRLPISSVDADPVAALVAGDLLSPTQSFSGLGYVEASTNFQGGTAAETNQEFAARGLTGLLAQTVGGQDNIDKLVGEAVQNADSNTVGVNSPLMTRDRDNVFNLSVGGKIDIYAKSGAIGEAAYVVDAEVVDVGLRTARITLSREQSAGVYRTGVVAISTTTPPTVIAGGITVLSVTHLPYVSTTEFNPQMPTEIERAFSANQLIEILIEDTRQTTGPTYIVPMTSPGDTITDAYEAQTEYQPGILTISQALASSLVRPPGVDLLVKAAVPCISTVGVVAQRPVSYNGRSASELEAAIATAINLLPVETQTLDNFTISGIVTTLEPTLTVLSVSLSGSVYGQNGTNYSIPQVGGKLTIPTNTAAKFSPTNTYFTTTANLVDVTLV